jgi:hypothetical protein
MSKQATIEVTIPECLNMDGLELRGNYRIIGYRQDILHALQRKHVAAFVVTALLRWTKSKRDDLVKIIKRRAENKLPPLTEEELKIWIHMSYEEFADEFDGLFSHNTIKEAVAYLIQEGIIQQRKNPNPKFKDYEYRLMLPVLRELLKSLPVNPAIRPRDNRNRKGKQSPNLVTPPELVTSPNPANESPELVDEPPKMVDESPNLANQYTISTQRQTKSDRKNEPSQQNTTVSTGDESFNHSFVQSFSSSEIVFSPEAEQVYQLAVKLNITHVKRDEKTRDNCALLVEKGFTTLEKIESLIEHCKQVSYLRGKTLNLKNLVNESTGWLQLHRKSTAAPITSSVASSMGVATAEWIAEQKRIQQRILEQEAAQGGQRQSLKERQAQLLAGKKLTVGNRHLQPLPTYRREGV